MITKETIKELEDIRRRSKGKSPEEIDEEIEEILSGLDDEELEKAKEMFNKINKGDVIENENNEETNEMYDLVGSCPTTQNNGCPVYLSRFSENKNKDVGWMEIFEFADKGVLDVIVDNFHKLKDKLNPPIKLGHDEQQTFVQESGFPAAGWITDLKRKEASNKLLAYFSSVPEEIIRLIENGTYKKVSAEIYNNFINPEDKKPMGPTLRAVSILGADIPRIKTLKDLAVVYHSDKQPYKITTSFIKENRMLKKIKDKIEYLNTDVKTILEKEENYDIAKFQEAITLLNEELENITSRMNKESQEDDSEAGRDKEDFVGAKLSETVKEQNSAIQKLSETVKSLNEDLNTANNHILESNKEQFKANAGRIFSPAFIEEALKVVTFTENDKVSDFINKIIKLQEGNTLLLPEDSIGDLDEVIVNPIKNKNSNDEIRNRVQAFAEKEKITFNDAFDKLSALNQLIN